MKETYNSLIIRYNDALTEEDFKSLAQKYAWLKARTAKLVVKVEQNGKPEITLPGFGPQELTDAGMVQGEPMKVSFIIRAPMNSFLDPHDQGYLDRITGYNPSGMRAKPFFFRPDGNPVDLLDLYADQTLFLVLNGKSFETVDHSMLRKPGLMTMGINNGAQVFKPHFWTCVDDPARFMESIWRDPSIQKFIPAGTFDRKIWDTTENILSETKVYDCPNVLGFRRNEKFTPDKFLSEPTINWGNHTSLGGGRSSMLVAIKIAYLLGFRTINLLGCDFMMSADYRYWFPEQRTPTAISNNLSSYRLMTSYFESLKPYFDAVGLKVFNLNPESGLKVFPFKSVEEAITDASHVITRLSGHSTDGMYVDRTKVNKSNT